jgi:hypothetical protein
MPRRDRHTPDEPDVVFEVMTRCFQGRNFLAATHHREVGEIYVGVWARAQLMYPGVRLADLVTLPNHYLCRALHNTCYVPRLVMP